MIFTIDKNDIENSFDKIAREILLQKAILINHTELRITEIEFYYFCKGKHEDNYTHTHDRDGGEWRFHNQGLDITFQWDDESDGGILIRGISYLVENGESKIISGPRNVIKKIFESFGKCDEQNTLSLIEADRLDCEIIKTFRHIPNKIVDEKFHNKYYRYITHIEDTEILKSEKEQIMKNHEVLNNIF